MFQGHLCRSVGCKPKYCLVLGLCGKCRFCVEKLAQWPRLLCTPITHRLTRKSQIQRLPNARNLEVWSPFFLRQNDRSRSTNTPSLWNRARDKTSGTRRYFCGLWHYGGYRLPSRSVALNRRKNRSWPAPLYWVVDNFKNKNAPNALLKLNISTRNFVFEHEGMPKMPGILTRCKRVLLVFLDYS